MIFWFISPDEELNTQAENKPSDFCENGQGLAPYPGALVENPFTNQITNIITNTTTTITTTTTVVVDKEFTQNL